MSMTVRVIIDILLAIGIFFNIVGVLGIIRMPDIFGRLQASTTVPAMGNLFLMIGGIVYAAATNPGEPGTYVKLAVILLMVLLTNPVSNHTLCRASYKMKVLPTTKLIIDDYKEDDPQ